MGINLQEHLYEDNLLHEVKDIRAEIAAMKTQQIIGSDIAAIATDRFIGSGAAVALSSTFADITGTEGTVTFSKKVFLIVHATWQIISGTSFSATPYWYDARIQLDDGSGYGPSGANPSHSSRDTGETQIYRTLNSFYKSTNSSTTFSVKLQAAASNQVGAVAVNSSCKWNYFACRDPNA